jgi:restriction endonuclease S subunit
MKTDTDKYQAQIVEYLEAIESLLEQATWGLLEELNLTKEVYIFLIILAF